MTSDRGCHRIALFAVGVAALTTVAFGTGALGTGALETGARETEAALEPTPQSVLHVEWAGCTDVLGPTDDPTCELDPSDPVLRLWARTVSGERAELVRGAHATTAPERVQGGWFWRLAIERDADALQLRAPTSGEIFSLPLTWRRPLPALDDALTPSEPDAARGRLRDALRQARSTAERIRLATGLADLEPNAERAAMLFRQIAWLADGRAGHPSRPRTRIHALARRHHLLYSALDDPVAAQQALDALPDAPRGDATSALIISIFRASWDIRLGQLRTAFRTLDDAERRAERLRDPFLVFIRQPQAHLASRLGLHQRALELVDTLRRQAAELTRPCRRSDLFTDLAWSQLLILEAVRHGDVRLGTLPDPSADLRAAADLAAECPASLGANTTINLALGHLEAGRLDEARDALEDLDALAPDAIGDGLVVTWRLEVAARLALAEGRASDALTLYDSLTEDAARRLESDAAWRAAIGRAQALRGLGRIDEALAAFADADDLLDRRAMTWPLLEPRGPESAFVFYERGSRLHLDLLLETGDEARALELARHARRRALAHLTAGQQLDDASPQQRDARHRQRARLANIRRAIDDLVAAEADATGRELQLLAERRRQLAVEQEAVLGAFGSPPGTAADRPLTAPRPGELLLTYHPLPTGWVGFAALDGRVEARRLDLGTLERDPAAALLAPFADAIRRADSLHFLPYGMLWSIDLHALPLDGGLLLEHLPVTFGLDLPRPPSARDGAEHMFTRRALVVEDPRRSLRHAAQEADQVTRYLAHTGWAVERLGPDDATPAAVTSAWAQGVVDLLHWAGHIDPRGTLQRPAGLLFDHGRRLGRADLFALESPPRRVVLSACSAVPTGDGHAPMHLGLGQAFLLAGSDWVLGPTAPVDDAAAAALTERFYAAWLARPGTEPAEALRRAQLARRVEHPEGSWRRFRLLVR
ncbi:MAG: CHAT domain-containing protein [Acidobacteriota bacterium]